MKKAADEAAARCMAQSHDAVRGPAIVPAVLNHEISIDRLPGLTR